MYVKKIKNILTLFMLLFGFTSITNAKIPEVPSVEAKSYVLMEYETGKILNKLDENKKLAPASLTKVMTAYIVFDELNSGRLSLTDTVKISKKAWKTTGSKTFIREGTSVLVEDLIKGMIVQSGNDAATALAEHISGSVSEFSTLMNFHAEQIGMLNSHFENPTGLPSRNHYTTAMDLAKLTKAMIDKFPEYYYIYQMKKFTYADITQSSRNRLLKEDLGFDGLKTGYTRDAGYCYIGSAKRGETRMIVTLLKEPSPEQRFEDAKKLVNYGFRFYETHQILTAAQPISELSTKVIKGEQDFLRVGSKKDVVVVLEKDTYKNIKYKVKMIETATAPIRLGTKVGEIQVILNEETIGQADLVALDTISEGSFLKKLKDATLSYF